MYKIITRIVVSNPLLDLGRYNSMSNKEIIAHDMNELLPGISKFIKRNEINISKLCKKTGIPRSTFYDFLYMDSSVLDRIQKIISYLGLEISIKPTHQ